MMNTIFIGKRLQGIELTFSLGANTKGIRQNLALMVDRPPVFAWLKSSLVPFEIQNPSFIVRHLPFLWCEQLFVAWLLAEIEREYVGNLH